MAGIMEFIDLTGFAEEFCYTGGWWYTYPSEKYEFVSWDDDIRNIWKNKIHVPNHQAVYVVVARILN